jgi:WD40 repeat protein
LLLTLIHAGVLVQFDAMHSLEISEKIKRVRWCARPNSSLLMLAANDRTVKLWKWKSLQTNVLKRFTRSLQLALLVAMFDLPSSVNLIDVLALCLRLC